MMAYGVMPAGFFLDGDGSDRDIAIGILDIMGAANIFATQATLGLSTATVPWLVDVVTGFIQATGSPTLPLPGTTAILAFNLHGAPGLPIKRIRVKMRLEGSAQVTFIGVVGTLDVPPEPVRTFTSLVTTTETTTDTDLDKEIFPIEVPFEQDKETIFFMIVNNLNDPADFMRITGIDYQIGQPSGAFTSPVPVPVALKQAGLPEDFILGGVKWANPTNAFPVRRP
jgi:hypothetical protein